MAYQPIPRKDEGGQDKLWSDDADAQELLNQILLELKKMNVHLSSITDEDIKEGDL